MRTIRYSVLPAVGPGEQARTGTLADLARELPHLIAWGVLPPRRVLNSVFGAGERDAGMGCRWEPFEVSPEECDELAEALALPVADGVPGWVQTSSDWMIWMMQSRGVPAEEHRRLDGAYEAAERAYREARARVGDDAPVEGELLERYVDSMEAGERLVEFVNRHMEREA